MALRQTAPRWEDQPATRPAGAPRGGGDEQPATASGSVLTVDIDSERFARHRGIEDGDVVGTLVAEAEQELGGPDRVYVRDLSGENAPVRGHFAPSRSGAIGVTIGPERAQPVVSNVPGGGAGLRIARVRPVTLGWQNQDDADRVLRALDRLAHDSPEDDTAR